MISNFNVATNRAWTNNDIPQTTKRLCSVYTLFSFHVFQLNKPRRAVWSIMYLRMFCVLIKIRPSRLLFVSVLMSRFMPSLLLIISYNYEVIIWTKPRVTGTHSVNIAFVIQCSDLEWLHVIGWIIRYNGSCVCLYKPALAVEYCIVLDAIKNTVQLFNSNEWLHYLQRIEYLEFHDLVPNVGYCLV